MAFRPEIFDYGQKPSPRAEFVLFDDYLRGRQPAPNRKVPADILAGLSTGDEPAKTFIMDQDQAISEKSGMPPLQIEEHQAQPGK